MDLSKYIDHTLLKATTTKNEIKELCKEAIEYGFYAVCVNGAFVSLAVRELIQSNVKVAAVVGFPLGAMNTDTKIFEAKKCIEDGAEEIDMVMNIGMLKEGNLKYIENEIRSIKKVMGDHILKVIIETCYLSEEEIKSSCRMAIRGEADYVKTSTGFGHGGATIKDVQLIKKEAGNTLKIKASGGIKDAETAIAEFKKRFNSEAFAQN